MDSQNQNTEAPQPQNPESQSPPTNPVAPPSQSPQRIVQPSASLVKELEDSKNNQQTQPISQPVQTVQANSTQQYQSQTRDISSVYPNPGEPVVTALINDEKVKPKLSKTKLILIGISAIILVIIGTGLYFFATNYNLKAALLDSRFRQYSYENDGTSYKVVFFKDSIIGKDPLVVNSEETALISPSEVDGTLPIQFESTIINSTTPASNINKAESCTAKYQSYAFRTYIPAATRSVNVCSLTIPNFDSNLYTAVFLNPKNQRVYSMVITESYEANKLSNTSYVQQLNDELTPITPYQNDIKTIFSSISN